MEARARLNEWFSIVSDTTNNISSANNFIRAGYRLSHSGAPLGMAEYTLLAQRHEIAALLFRASLDH
ncbi:hypothetical protein [Bradyrhizobium sp. CCBAU 051011]|uniref:hypothetical protein n=1 Tax=Bradyrhizobium sp. CCBAU 051011 TaxID=858422 RepID=UPI00352B8D89